MKCLKKLTASVLLSSLLLSNFCFALNPNSTYYREVINVPHGKIVKIQEENIDKSVSYYHYPTQEIFTFSDKNFVNELDNFVIENNLVEVSTSTEEYERVRDFFETEYPKQIKDYKFELNRYFVSPNLENQTKNSYDLITNATTTVLIEDSFIPLTSTTSTTTNPYQSATTLIATTTPTQTYQPPAVLAINNPYGYPYTYVNNIPVFILPNGTTSTDPLTRIYNTIAKNLNNLTIASTSASSSITYTKFYPTQNYEYDTRGVITINIPFNGKIVGTYKYDSSTSLGTSATPPEISFATLNHLGTPVILTDTSSNLTQKIKRDEWGTISTNSYDVNAVTNTSLGYTNQRQDADSNLTYIHQRYLSTQNKVWLSVDPVQYDSFNKDFFLLNPQSQNSYSYANMDPINNVDPDGRFIQAAVTVVARMIFATGIGSLLGSYAGDVTANYQNIADKKTTNTYSNLFKPRQDAVNGYGKDFWNNLQINTTSEIAKGSSEKVLTSKLGATGKLVTAGKNITSATAAGVTAYNIERSDGKSKSEAITKSLIVGGVSLLTGTTVSISKGIPAEAAGTAVKTGIFGTSVNPKFFIGAHAIREYQSEALEGYVEGVAGANVLYLERVNNE